MLPHMRFTPIASSSQGNAYIVEDGKTTLLLECGLARRTLNKRLEKKLGITCADCAGVLVSHEHKDHAKAAAELLKDGATIFMSEGTAEALELEGVEACASMEQFSLGSMDIVPFAVFHDAQEPLGFLVRSRLDGEELVFATDTVNLGYRFPGATILAIEANYDKDILARCERLPEKTRERITNTHMEIDTLCRYLKGLDLQGCREIWLAGPKVFELEGESFASQNLVRIEPKKDFPEKLTLTGLDSVCKLIRNEANDLFQADQILVQVESYNTVKVFTTLDGEMDRCWLYQCRADTPEAKTNRWLDHEEAVIQLQSMYIPNSDTAYLLQLLSSVSKDSKVTTLDNGVTQSVEARTGVALRGSVPVKPRVKLMPFRTFLEVAQPESEFILRLDSNGQINLIGADGGAWKLEAVRSIAAYFDEQLGDLVKAGRVVVLR